MKRIIGLSFVLLVKVSLLVAQPTCTSNPLTVTPSKNFSAIAWTSTGGGACPPAANFTGNIRMDMANGVTVTMTTSMTITGNFILTNTGVSTLRIPVGVTIHVTGNMGDLNNNSVTYDVNGVLIVDGTLQGKNNNVFQGTGTIAGGALDIKNGATCGTPCPITGNFDNCSSGTGGSAQVFCTSVLPVNLLYFTAVAKEDVVALNWATSMEENFSKFVVQRSHDGVVFEDIGEIPGKGFDIHNVQSKYDFIDEAPLLGFNYYRLKAVDIDESFQYFGVKAVKIRGGKRVAVYPNPLNGNIVSFRTNFSPSESDRVVLLNQLGGEVYNGMAGTNSILLQNKLRSGVYVLRYIAKDFEQVVRVVVHN